VTRLAAVALVVALAAAGCGGFGGGPAVPEGGAAMSNATSLPIAVEVNGDWVGTYPAWTEAAGIAIERGDPPWRVSFLTPDGATAVSISARPGQSTSGRWITKCGTLVVWFGDRPGDALEIDPAAPRPPGPPCT
jgi:hypothetical protein